MFDYTSYAGGGRLVKLAPPSADGTLTTLFPTDELPAVCWTDADFEQQVQGCIAGADIMSYDINFNADAIVFSASIGHRPIATSSIRSASTGTTSSS